MKYRLEILGNESKITEAGSVMSWIFIMIKTNFDKNK